MTHVEAFDMAIELAVAAPDDERSARAVDLAEQIAQHLTAEQVAQVMMKYEMEKAQ